MNNSISSDSQFFIYGENELNALKSKDPLLCAAIDEIGYIKRAVIPDMFEALVNSIIGQQISTKAQATIWARFKEKFAPLNAQNILAASCDEIQSCGISMRKVTYIQDIAQAVADKSLDLKALSHMKDEEVCKRLVAIKGIGVWTAEMLMIFSMQRANILSWDDLAIHRGLRMLYRHKKITPQLFAKYKRRYSPYATVASLYLWAIAGGACSNLVDIAPKNSPKKKA